MVAKLQIERTPDLLEVIAVPKNIPDEVLWLLRVLLETIEIVCSLHYFADDKFVRQKAHNKQVDTKSAHFWAQLFMRFLKKENFSTPVLISVLQCLKEATIKESLGTNIPRDSCWNQLPGTLRLYEFAAFIGANDNEKDAKLVEVILVELHHRIRLKV